MLEPVSQKQRLPLSYPTQAQIRRAVDAVKKSGVKVGGVEVHPDGIICVLSRTSRAASDKGMESFFDED